jgi:glyoxylase-like metal-dependent hydrolase (beta-lactamase superfamily II)
VSLVQAGTFRSDAGVLFGPVPWVLWRPWAEGELDENRRLLQALNCLLVETPAGRVLVETGIGERMDEHHRAQRGVSGKPILPSLRDAAVDPASIDIVAVSHLHFDHAGGLLTADGGRAFANARVVAQADEWRFALPVRPGDTLRYRGTVLESRISATKPDRGIVKFRWELLNQRDEVVVSIVGTQFYLRRT